MNSNFDHYTTIVNSGNINGGVDGILGGDGLDYITNHGLIAGGTLSLELGDGKDVVDNSFGVLSGKADLGLDDDIFFGGHTQFSVDGKAGTDTISFQKVGGGFIIDLGAGTATDGVVIDKITNFENATGSSGDDTITGTADQNVLDGGPGGSDIIQGNGPGTYLPGQVYGAAPGLPGDNNNTVTNTNLATPTALNPGDTVSYATNTLGVTVNLATQTSNDGVNTDTLVGIQSATGSAFNDTLLGNNNSNVLRGGAGDDTQTGFGGSDAFLYKELNFGHDTITDFSIPESDVLAFDTTLFQPTSLTYSQVNATTVQVTWDAADTISVHNVNGLAVADVQSHTVFV